jgi:hypothetical protein
MYSAMTMMIIAPTAEPEKLWQICTNHIGT